MASRHHDEGGFGSSGGLNQVLLAVLGQCATTAADLEEGPDDFGFGHLRWQPPASAAPHELLGGCQGCIDCP